MAGANTDAVERLQRWLIIALIAIVGVLVIVLGLRMLGQRTEILGPIMAPSGSTATGSSSDVTERLTAARTAMAGSRLVSPAGDNAYEHYLAVLDQQPDNVSAREALNDLYGIAVSSAEQAIAANDFEDAERLVGLLARSNPSSFTVANLRQRIERGAAAAQQANAQREAAANAANAAPGATTAAAPATTPAPSAATPAPEPASDLASVASPTSAPPTATPPAPAPQTAAPQTAAAPAVTRTTTTTPPPVSAAPAVREARLLSRVDPQYPREAMRGRQQGWVEVEFTIGRDGSVSDARVVASRPSRVFDRAATTAIQGWRFEPRTENGQAVATRLRQRFDFRLD